MIYRRPHSLLCENQDLSGSVSHLPPTPSLPTVSLCLCLVVRWTFPRYQVCIVTGVFKSGYAEGCTLENRERDTGLWRMGLMTFAR